jgi:putative copper export protein
LTVLLGAAWLHIWSMIPAEGARIFPATAWPRLHGLYLLCLAMLTASSSGMLVLRSMEMSGVGFSEVRMVLPTILLKTHFGSMWLLRLAGLFCSWMIWWAGKRHPASRLMACSLFITAGIISFSRSSSGHLADFGDFSVQQLGDFLHLLAVSCWAGTLIAVAVLFPPTTIGTKDQVGCLSRLADRFYLLFGSVLAVLVFSGWQNSWLLVRSFQALVNSPYGWILSVKLLLFFVLVSRFIAPPAHDRDDHLYVMNFLTRTRLEACLAVGILLCVAFLIHRVPARHQVHQAFTGTTVQYGGEHIHAAFHEAEPLVSLETDPDEIIVGVPVRMTLRIMDAESRPFQGLTIIHERILHAVIIGKDLEVFAHIHPEDHTPITTQMMEKAMFPLQFTFPRTGEYLLGIDFAKDEEFYSKTFILTVAAAAIMKEPAIDFSTRKNFGEYQVLLTVPDGPIVAGTETKIRYVVRKNGEELVDLVPYLGAAMHLSIVSADLGTFIHAHGVVPGAEVHFGHLHTRIPAKFGPEIEADIIFPTRGLYKIFAQFKHQERVVLADFMVNVR